MRGKRAKRGDGKEILIVALGHQLVVTVDRRHERFDVDAHLLGHLLYGRLGRLGVFGNLVVTDGDCGPCQTQRVLLCSGLGPGNGLHQRGRLGWGDVL